MDRERRIRLDSSSYSVPLYEAYNTAVNVWFAGLRTYGVERLRDLPNDQQEQLKKEVITTWQMLGIYDVVIAWRAERNGNGADKGGAQEGARPGEGEQGGPLQEAG